jgi:hypothetical protein
MAGPDLEWRRRVVGALAAVVAVGLVIGGVLGAVAYSTARVAGLVEETAQASGPVAAARDGDVPERASSEPSPSVTSAPSPDPAQDRSDQDPPARGEKAAKRPAKDRKKGARADKRIRPTLTASPRDVRRMGRIRLSGSYPGHRGARLVVQRREGGRWMRFPVSVTVRSGRFRTWVASGHRGVNRFRVVDSRTRRASDPVRVRVR